MKNNYTVLHLHSDLSLLDSCTKFQDYIDKAVELGQKAICFTEHGNIFNWIAKKRTGANSPGSIKVICEDKLFPCIKECANYYNVKYQTMVSWLNGDNKIPVEWVMKGLKKYE